MPAIVATAAVAAFLGLEGRLRQGAEARTLDAGEGDRGTTRAIGAAVPVALLGPPLAALLPGRRLPAGVGWLGTALTAGGIGLHVWANRTLGASYTRTLRVRAEQAVVDSGPYSRVRHPGYAGSLLLWAGYALSWQALPAMLAAVPMVPAYARRIAVEEAMLSSALGAGYERYRERTRRLVPGLY